MKNKETQIHTHLQDALQLHSSFVSLFKYSLGLSHSLFQALDLPLHHQPTDLPEEGLCQNNMRL